ncbi:AN1-type zinc finger protein 5 [Scaptodrosophila lebanonensis]|uniref:AN1-type zinc finger protein 5 n=1 Tax=Drosophila lebanonensis TaxID=7225 RepID=A0A6J2U1V1_DROLE|nr:AN1-type zinc finger protein 5 [Scaptodrosophila lebanonensis]
MKDKNTRDYPQPEDDSMDSMASSSGTSGGSGSGTNNNRNTPKLGLPIRNSRKLAEPGTEGPNPSNGGSAVNQKATVEAEMKPAPQRKIICLECRMKLALLGKICRCGVPNCTVHPYDSRIDDDTSSDSDSNSTITIRHSELAIKNYKDTIGLSARPDTEQLSKNSGDELLAINQPMDDEVGAWKVEAEEGQAVDKKVDTSVDMPDTTKKNRCATCNKKLGIIGGYPCRCGLSFCGFHRYSDRHNCTFDYREMGADEIRRANPVVIANKLNKL